MILSNKCPGCDDVAVKQISQGELVTEGPVWVAIGWTSGDYEHDQEILFCPFCGLDLNATRPANPPKE